MTRSSPADTQIFQFHAYRLDRLPKWPMYVAEADCDQPIILELAEPPAELAHDGRALDNHTRGNRSSAAQRNESPAVVRQRTPSRTVRLEANLDRLICELEAEANRVTP